MGRTIIFCCLLALYSNIECGNIFRKGGINNAENSFRRNVDTNRQWSHNEGIHKIYANDEAAPMLNDNQLRFPYYLKDISNTRETRELPFYRTMKYHGDELKEFQPGLNDNHQLGLHGKKVTDDNLDTRETNEFPWAAGVPKQKAYDQPGLHDEESGLKQRSVPRRWHILPRPKEQRIPSDDAQYDDLQEFMFED